MAKSPPEGGGGGNSHVKGAGMFLVSLSLGCKFRILVSLRVFRAKNSVRILTPSRCRLGLHMMKYRNVFSNGIFLVQKKLEPRPNWSSLGV